jgi:hypothetical protein
VIDPRLASRLVDALAPSGDSHRPVVVAEQDADRVAGFAPAVQVAAGVRDRRPWIRVASEAVRDFRDGQATKSSRAKCREGVSGVERLHKCKRFRRQLHLPTQDRR